MNFLLVLGTFCICTPLFAQTQYEKRLQRARELMGIGDWNNAVREFDELIIGDSNKIEFYFARGYARAKLQHYRECIEDFTKVLELDSTFNEAHTNRGYAYRKIGQLDLALADFETEAKLHHNPYSFEHLAYCRYLLRDYDSALRDASRSIKLDSTNSIAYKTRALIYSALGNLEFACKDVEAAKMYGIQKYPEWFQELSTVSKKCTEQN
jgi:tetratricopeptide (TPR) repeat protein